MRILIVEDEFRLADAIKASLQKNTYIVDIACDGEEGYNKALAQIYDIIILDIMLPKRNGFEIVKKLREEGISVPIIMLTAKAQLEDKIKGLDSGADDYLTKPFEMEELLARIRALSRRKGEVTDNILIFGDLELDLKTCEITCTTTGKSIKLAAKEYAILEYLMKNSRQVIKREQLIEKIWGFDNEAEYNNAEVYISFTRKKISFIQSIVKIKALRGLGYRLETNDDKETSN